MAQEMSVKLYEKLPDGELKELEERVWSGNMIAALEHVNYLVVGKREFETVEGRLNVDEGKLELLLVPIAHD
nr:hypothetical protein [Paenibacillus senegalimassiliensis]